MHAGCLLSKLSLGTLSQSLYSLAAKSTGLLICRTGQTHSQWGGHQPALSLWGTNLNSPLRPSVFSLDVSARPPQYICPPTNQHEEAL